MNPRIKTWKTYQPKRYKVWLLAVALALTLPILLLANSARFGVESKHILERAAEPDSLEEQTGLLLENEVATRGEADTASLPSIENTIREMAGELDADML